MGASSQQGLNSPLVTAATGGANLTTDQGLKASGIQGGINSIGGKLGNEMGGALGAGYDKPQMANIQQVVSPEQLQQGQGGVNNSLQSQQNLLNALQAQNGIGQQTAALQGLQGTAGQFQNIANGTGPNPARAMLNQATGQNVANQAALMAGQRGAGANVGLMARQAAQQGANTQQQAVGQGATMQANQSLNALSGMANVQNNIAGLANNMAANQMGGTQANTQANLANAGQLQGAAGAQNQANVASQGNVNTGNAALLNTGMQGKQKLLGGVLSGAGSIAGLAGGGEVHHMGLGGPVAGPSSSFGQFLQGWKSNSAPVESEEPKVEEPKIESPKEDKDDSSSAITKLAPLALMAAKGGMVNTMLSEKEVIVPPRAANDPNKAAQYVKKEMATGGGVKAKTPNEKAVKEGNSYSNDRIPKKVEEGSIVIPRSVTESKDPIKASADFVSKVLAKRRTK